MQEWDTDQVTSWRGQENSFFSKKQWNVLFKKLFGWIWMHNIHISKNTVQGNIMFFDWSSWNTQQKHLSLTIICIWNATPTNRCFRSDWLGSHIVATKKKTALLFSFGGGSNEIKKGCTTPCAKKVSCTLQQHHFSLSIFLYWTIPQSSNAFSSNLVKRLITAHYSNDISLLYFMNLTAR